jgi:hypothetical protein
MKRFLLALSVLSLISMHLFAWTNGELLIWMDTDRGHGLEPIAKKFGSDFGVKVKIEAPENITDSFPIAAQAGTGPDIVIWAHDKVGEWAEDHGNHRAGQPNTYAREKTGRAPLEFTYEWRQILTVRSASLRRRKCRISSRCGALDGRAQTPECNLP